MRDHNDAHILSRAQPYYRRRSWLEEYLWLVFIVKRELNRERGDINWKFAQKGPPEVRLQRITPGMRSQRTFVGGPAAIPWGLHEFPWQNC
jgi:hypothetical protein